MFIKKQSSKGPQDVRNLQEKLRPLWSRFQFFTGHCPMSGANIQDLKTSFF